MDYNYLLSKRLKTILEKYFSGNYSAMSRMLGITDSGLGSYIRGKKLKDGGIKYSSPSVDIIASIADKLEINSEWLITGKGEMKKESGHDPGNGDEHNKSRLREDRLLSIIESQQRSIEYLSKKGGLNGEGMISESTRKTS